MNVENKMEITIYNKNDFTIKGQLKKRNNAKTYTEKEFKDYIKNNNLTLSQRYMDLTGDISNGLIYRCYYRGILIGTSKIYKEIQIEVNKMENKKIIQTIEENETYKKILEDSFGGVCYMNKKENYNITTLKPLFEELKNLNLIYCIDGTMKGVGNFLKVI